MVVKIRNTLGRAPLLALLALVASAVLHPRPAFGQAELPRVFLDTTYAPPFAGRTITVSAGGDLQTALNAAQPGDIIELEAGATFAGNFRLPNKLGTGWIYIRSSAHASLPPPGSRVSPAHAQLMPKLVPPALEPLSSAPVIAADPGAHHYRFVGIEIAATHSATTSTYENLILLGAGTEITPDQLPMDIVFDRSYIHGTPTGNVRRGIALNGARMAVIDSYLYEFHEVSVDAQAIAGWSGPGPFKVVNNYIEAAGANVTFGGPAPRIAALVPSDIEIRGNHLFKPLSWRVGDPSYAGIHWAVKNLLDLKNARRVLVEGTVFEHSWLDVQAGFAIVLVPRNEGGTAPWSVVEDVTLTNNLVCHAAGGLGMLGFSVGSVQQTKRIVIRNNLFDDIDGATWGGGFNGRLFTLIDGTADVTIDHNTGFQTGPIIIADGPLPHTGFVYTNNITPHNESGVAGNATDPGNETLNTWFPGHIFAKNVMQGANCAVYPADNFCPVTWDEVAFVDKRGGNYRLQAASPYKHAGTDGRDIGADIEAIKAGTGRDNCLLSP